MGHKMSRGKQQVLYTYLPTNTFDFQGGSIARVQYVRGNIADDINPRFLVARIREDASAWPDEAEFRPALRDVTLQDADRFVLIDPAEVSAELFPRVFWCDRCGRVYDLSNSNNLPPVACPRCNGGHLTQLRFILVHRCGEVRPLSPPTCSNCRGHSGHMALVTHGSERISEFQWVCLRCGTSAGGVFGGYCPACEWPGATNEEQLELRRMRVLVHRAGPTFYARSVTLLNIPQRRLDGFFALGDVWKPLAAANFLGLPEIADRRLEDIQPSPSRDDGAGPGLAAADLDALMARQANGELTYEEFVEEMQRLRAQRSQEQQESVPQGIADRLIERTGVNAGIWDRAGQEMLEAILPLETGNPRDLFELSDADRKRISRYDDAHRIAARLGLKGLTLLDDFPIVKGTYGYTRLEPSPGDGDTCRTRLNPFPTQPNSGQRIPIFIDSVRADALMLRLDPERVHCWLELNGITPAIPAGTELALARQAFFVRLFDGAPLRQTLPDSPLRMVFTLLHTFSHLAVRQAALLCGLDRTSLSEYLLPSTLTFSLYCNHRFGATIGALSALFEQTLVEWLEANRDAYRCVYDPVCRERDSGCHACAHLTETSCGYFNLNLGRVFLFGGYDQKADRELVGYFDPVLDEDVETIQAS
ncbi:MAG: hypothetical protein J5I65_16000 [Aridibacter famidurans]|nr:hypothetical protein [Aridibacter famidurans]